MRKDFFYCLGKGIFRFRWFVLIAWLLLILAFVPHASKLMEPFKAIGFTDPNSESAVASKLLNDKIGYGYNQLVVIYKSKNLTANQPVFLKEIKDSLAPLSKFPLPHMIVYPDDNPKQISKDKHTAYAVILFKGNKEIDSQSLKDFKASVKTPPHLTVKFGGEPIFLDDSKKQTQIDLYKSDFIATPVAILTMLLVFGSFIAAGLPIVLGGACAFLILSGLFLLGHLFNLSVFTINIALLLGLCVSLDYAILIISRFRYEINHEKDTLEAIAVTSSTAGKAVFFSGLAVLASLSALFLFPINILFSVGVGGVTAVLVSIFVAVILLPAILSLLGKKINSLRIPYLFSYKHSPYWSWLVTKVVYNPWKFFIFIMAVLLILSYPLFKIEFGISDFRILPKTLESRQVFETFKDKFGESKLAPILLVMHAEKGNFFDKKNLYNLYDFVNKIKKNPDIKDVSSIVSGQPNFTKEQYYALYNSQKDHWPASLKNSLKATTHENVTVVTVISKYLSTSPQTKALIEDFKNIELNNGLDIKVAGTTANTMDVLKSISHTFMYAVGWILLFTYVILLVLFRSVFLPLKAILITILSIGASYGVLVFIIQQGHFSELLHLEAQGMLDISLLIIIFCTLFGLSMDYEVFLLTRIKEAYEKTGNSIKSIIYGIDHSSKIISSAALIVIFICFSFMAAETLIVKAFGLGIAVAIFVDAFLIRAILVPAVMAILGDWNWYLPSWLDRILPKISFNPDETTDEENGFF